MGIREEVMSKSKSSLKEKIFFLNVHYGYSVIEKINYLENEFCESDGRVLIIYHGQRNFDDLVESYGSNCMELNDALVNTNDAKKYIIVDAYADLITIIDGEYEINPALKKLLGYIDIVVFMNVNLIAKAMIQEIEYIFSNIPIFCIGDSEGYIMDGSVLTALHNTKYVNTEIYKMKGVNADILHYIKKIRTGSINRITHSTEKDLKVEIVPGEEDFFDMDEAMNYDIIIDTTSRHREYNVAFRDLSGFGFIPNINESFVNISPFIAETTSGVKIAVDKHNIFKIKQVIKENGVLKIRTSFRGKDIIIPVNTQYLEDISSCEITDDLDIVRYDYGVKFEYGYVIPPCVAINKSFTDVLIYFTNPNGVYIRQLIMCILMSCARSFKIKTDDEYYL